MRNIFENEIVKEDLANTYTRYSNSWPKLRDKTILITGAYGMIPSYITYFLIYLNEIHNYNIHIVAIGRNRKKAYQRFSCFIDKEWFTFLEQDVSSKIEYNKKIDYIIHGASPASSSHYNIDPVNVIKSNIFGAFSTLELAVQHNIEGYLFFSSCEVYGEVDKSVINETDTAIGIDTLDVRNCYSESKRLGENICSSYQHQHNIPIKIARLAHTFGPTLDLNDERVFSQFISNIINNEDITLRSDGKAVRTFCYIADATAGLLKILVEGEGAYNVTNKLARISIGKLAQMLVTLYPEKNLHVECQLRDTHTSYLESSSKVQPIYNTDKLEGLGWECHYTLQKSFTRTIEALTTCCIDE